MTTCIAQPYHHDFRERVWTRRLTVWGVHQNQADETMKYLATQSRCISLRKATCACKAAGATLTSRLDFQNSRRVHFAVARKIFDKEIGQVGNLEMITRL